MLTCTHCGSTESDDGFCQQCGKPMKDDSENQTKPESDSD